MRRKIARPKNLKGVNGKQPIAVADILPFLPHEDGFFDSRHWIFEDTGGVFPFALTTRVEANHQQYLRQYNYLNDNMDGMTMERPDGKGWVYDETNELWFRIRKLTPRECFRLMDVSDSDIDKMSATTVNKKGKEIPVISKSARYKLAGNSIVVNPMYLTFLHLFCPEKAREMDRMNAGENDVCVQQLTLFD